MNLKFLGRGSAFNVYEGNTSAYFMLNYELFLIDCGETVFESLMKKYVLDDVDKINVMITHTHSDHVGSLGSLISYAYALLGIRVNIIIGPNVEYKDDLIKILDGFNCQNKYSFVDIKRYLNQYSYIKKIEFLEEVHSSDMKCYGILFHTNNGIIYYTGDTSSTNNIVKLINSNENIHSIYTDCSNIPNGKHLFIGDLVDSIPDNIKHKVYCMHINNNQCFEDAYNNGFKVVEVK